MEPFHAAHLVAVGIWLGVVITEVLFELAGSDADSLRAAAGFHYNVDKFGELPILFAWRACRGRSWKQLSRVL